MIFICIKNQLSLYSGPYNITIGKKYEAIGEPIYFRYGDNILIIDDKGLELTVPLKCFQIDISDLMND